VTEETTADNVVIGAVQFEEKWFSNLESAELLVAARLPEVGFVQPFKARQVVEPVTIRDADEEAHGVRL
jgi:hypothetical protein